MKETIEQRPLAQLISIMELFILPIVKFEQALNRR